MEYNELKCMVGEICDEYRAKNETLLMSMSLASVSCDNCTNCIKGKCAKKSFEELKHIIEVN